MYRTSCAAHRAERPGRYAVRPGRQPPHPGQRPSAGLACVTGRFQPVHHQHLDLFEIALREAGYLIVAVTNPEPRRPPRENHTGIAHLPTHSGWTGSATAPSPSSATAPLPRPRQANRAVFLGHRITARPVPALADPPTTSGCD